MLNKKIFIISIFLFVLIDAVFATDGFHAIVSSGNDTWNFGLSENYDDQLSYSMHNKLSYKGLYYLFNAEGYTNRGFKENGNFYSGRFDKFDFLAGYYCELPIGKLLVLEFEPEVGLSMIGDFGLDWSQNIVHKISKINPVELPYDFNDRSGHLAANGRANIAFNLLHFDNSQLRGKLFMQSKNVFDFELSQSFGLEFALSRDNSDVRTAYFFLGYGMAESFSETMTEKLYADNIRGIEYGFGVNSGLFAIDYSKFMQSGYGYTHLSLDIVPLFTKATFKDEDFFVSCGKCNFLDREYSDNQLGYRFENNVSIVLKNRYASGFPILDGTELNNTAVRYKRNYSFNSIGCRYEYTFKPHGFVTLYSQLNVGISKWDFAYLYNMNRDVSMMEDAKKRRNLFFADIEVGINLIREKLLVCENAQYQFNIFTGLVYIPAKETVTDILTRDNSHKTDFKFKGVAPYVGIGLRVGIDV